MRGVGAVGSTRGAAGGRVVWNMAGGLPAAATTPPTVPHTPRVDRGARHRLAMSKLGLQGRGTELGPRSRPAMTRKMRSVHGPAAASCIQPISSNTLAWHCPLTRWALGQQHPASSEARPARGIAGGISLFSRVRRSLTAHALSPTRRVCVRLSSRPSRGTARADEPASCDVSATRRLGLRVTSPRNLVRASGRRARARGAPRV